MNGSSDYEEYSVKVRCKSYIGAMGADTVPFVKWVLALNLYIVRIRGVLFASIAFATLLKD